MNRVCPQSRKTYFLFRLIAQRAQRKCLDAEGRFKSVNGQRLVLPVHVHHIVFPTPADNPVGALVRLLKANSSPVDSDKDVGTGSKILGDENLRLGGDTRIGRVNTPESLPELENEIGRRRGLFVTRYEKFDRHAEGLSIHHFRG